MIKAMKNVLVIGRELQLITTLLQQEGLTIVAQNPDVVVTHGGDGYLLDAERQYPGVPKLPLRYNSVCKTCVDHDTTHAIRALAKGTISQTTIAKLTAKVDGRTVYALNEIALHHVRPNQAVRFTVRINQEEQIEEAIGDGLIVATPFGSHAYYRSVTNSTFRTGIGIAYNNTTEAIDHMIVRETDHVHVTIGRGPAYFLVDNDPQIPMVQAGEVFDVHLSDRFATILGLDHFRCPDCDDPIMLADEPEGETS